MIALHPKLAATIGVLCMSVGFSNGSYLRATHLQSQQHEDAIDAPNNNADETDTIDLINDERDVVDLLRYEHDVIDLLKDERERSLKDDKKDDEKKQEARAPIGQTGAYNVEIKENDGKSWVQSWGSSNKDEKDDKDKKDDDKGENDGGGGQAKTKGGKNCDYQLESNQKLTIGGRNFGMGCDNVDRCLANAMPNQMARRCPKQYRPSCGGFCVTGCKSVKDADGNTYPLDWEHFKNNQDATAHLWAFGETTMPCPYQN